MAEKKIKVVKNEADDCLSFFLTRQHLQHHDHGLTSGF